MWNPENISESTSVERFVFSHNTPMKDVAPIMINPGKKMEGAATSVKESE